MDLNIPGLIDVYVVKSRRHALALAKFRVRGGATARVRRIHSCFAVQGYNRGRGYAVLVF